MDLRDFLIEAITRNRRDTLNLVQDLSEDDLAWAPTPTANPIGFLLWHVARSEDRYFMFSGGVPQVWQAQGWHQKFGLGENETGNSWAPEQARAFRAPSKQALLDYMDAVRQSGLKVIKALDLTRLSDTPRPDRPGVTIANMLQNAISHEAHHQGAIEYLVGLRRSRAAV